MVEFQPVVYYDVREPKTIINKLEEFGLNMKPSQLPVGDYLISEDCVIERKSINDFINSIIDLRLFDQVLRMKQDFNKVIYILEGDIEDNHHLRKISNASFYGAMMSLIIDYGASVITTKSDYDTAFLIYSMVKHIHTDLKHLPRVKGRRKMNSDDEFQRGLVESLPGIGPMTAINLLKEFGSIKNIADARVDELSKVERIGKKKAQRIHDILNRNYRIYNDRLSELLHKNR